MAFSVDQFKQALVLDGARPNLFQIQLSFPPIVDYGIARDLTFLANGTQLPASTVGVARQHYFGREVKFPGNRTFQPWSINIINDESFDLRNAFEQWLNAINGNGTNVRDAGARYSSQYSVEASVTQFSKDGIPIKVYAFAGLFPTQVDPINLNWGSNDQIEEFGVTFEYQYWYDTAPNFGATPVAPNADATLLR